MSRDPQLRAAARAAQRSARFAGKSCSTCGATEQLSSTPAGVYCYGHLPSTAAFELDHPAGRSNMPHFAIAERPNSHRRVTEKRTTFGMDDWPPAGSDPFLLAAQFLGGIASLLLLLADWLIEASRAVARSGASLPPFPFVP